MNSDPSSAPTAPGGIQDVLTGQKLVIYAIIISVASYASYALNQYLGIAVNLLVFVLSMVGVYRLTTGFGYATGKKILYIVLMFIPLVSLVTLLVLNSRATNALRAAGYKVGLMGAQV